MFDLLAHIVPGLILSFIFAELIMAIPPKEVAKINNYAAHFK
jgi:hypothetical protein